MVRVRSVFGKTSSAAARLAHQSMNQWGAVVLRGALGANAETFSDFAAELRYLHPQYVQPGLTWDGGHRHEVASRVTNASSDPPGLEITPHCENQDCPRSPAYVLFACARPASHGGQTPLYDLKSAEQYLRATPVGERFLADLEAHGTISQRFYPSELDPRASLITSVNYPRIHDKFPAKDDTAAWESLRTSFSIHGAKHWFEPSTGSMRMEWKMPGFAKHPVTGDDVFFYGYGTHGSYFDKFLPGLPFHDRPFHSKLGCGREVTKEEVDVMSAAWASAVDRFEWQSGDVLCVDNFRYAHGRDRFQEAFQGERNVMVSNGNTVHWAASYKASKGFSTATSTSATAPQCNY